MDASLTDSTVIERHTQDLPMPDIPPWLEQPISAQTKQQKTLMDEQAEQQEKILEALTKLKTQRQQDRCHVKIGPFKSRTNLAHFNVKLDPRCHKFFDFSEGGPKQVQEGPNYRLPLEKRCHLFHYLLYM